MDLTREFVFLNEVVDRGPAHAGAGGDALEAGKGFLSHCRSFERYRPCVAELDND